MTGSTLRRLVLVLGICGAGLAFAGSSDITKRDAEGGSVELTNLGEEDAPVVVAAPVKAPSPPAARAATVAKAADRPAAVRAPAPAVRDLRSREKSKDEEDVATDEAVAERQNERLAGDAASDPSAHESGYAGTASMGGYGFGAPTYSGGSVGTVGSSGGIGGSNGAGGMGNSIGTGGVGGSTAGAGAGTASVTDGSSVASSGGNTSGGSASSGSGVTSPGTGATTPGSVLDSPEMLAARLEQYRQIMLAEQRGQNGLPANPAVQRRYLMINRSGYQGMGF